MDVSIVIPSWNVRDLLRKNLASIFAHTPGLQVEVSVTDNGSSDGSADMMRQEFPQVKLIANEVNRGFGTAINQSIRATAGRYILVYNDDAEFVDDNLAKLVALMDSDPKIGVLGCRITNLDGSTQASVRRDPSFFDQAIILTKLHNFFPKLINKYLCTDFDYTKEQEVRQLMGAFLLLPRNLMEKLGLFDENIFLWFEDVDLQRRIRKVGYKVLYAPQMVIRHVKGASFGKILPWRLQLIWGKSQRYYFWKHQAYLTFVGLLPFQLIGLILAGIVQFIGKGAFRRWMKEKYGH